MRGSRFRVEESADSRKERQKKDYIMGKKSKAKTQAVPSPSKAPRQPWFDSLSLIYLGLLVYLGALILASVLNINTLFFASAGFYAFMGKLQTVGASAVGVVILAMIYHSRTKV